MAAAATADVEKFAADIRENWEELQALPEEFRDLGDRVLVLGRLKGRGKGSGAPVDMPYAGILDFRGERIWRHRVYIDRAEGLRAAGLQDASVSGVVPLTTARDEERRPGSHPGLPPLSTSSGRPLRPQVSRHQGSAVRWKGRWSGFSPRTRGAPTSSRPLATVSRLGSSPIPLPKPSRIAPDRAISARGMTGRIASKHA